MRMLFTRMVRKTAAGITNCKCGFDSKTSVPVVVMLEFGEKRKVGERDNPDKLMQISRLSRFRRSSKKWNFTNQGDLRKWRPTLCKGYRLVDVATVQGSVVPHNQKEMFLRNILLYKGWICRSRTIEGFSRQWSQQQQVAGAVYVKDKDISSALLPVCSRSFLKVPRLSHHQNDLLQTVEPVNRIPSLANPYFSLNQRARRIC